jgi:hypothetical protein
MVTRLTRDANPASKKSSDKDNEYARDPGGDNFPFRLAPVRHGRLSFPSLRAVTFKLLTGLEITEISSGTPIGTIAAV